MNSVLNSARNEGGSRQDRVGGERYFVKAKLRRINFVEEEWGKDVPEHYPALDPTEAAAKTETLRTEIQSLREMVELLEGVQASLLYFQSGSASAPQPVHEFVAIDVLSNRNIRQRKAKAALLKELGIAIPAE